MKGIATCLERMALPPGAVFEATLEDVSKADAKAEVLGSARIENPGNPLIAFAIPYDARCSLLATGTRSREPARAAFHPPSGGQAGQVTRARVTQQQLELLDATGTVLARFEAVHMR